MKALQYLFAALLLCLSLAAPAMAGDGTSQPANPLDATTSANCEPTHCYRFGWLESGSWGGFAGAQAITCIASSNVPDGLAFAAGSSTEHEMVNSELWVLQTNSSPYYWTEAGVTDGNNNLGRHLFWADKTLNGFTWHWGPAVSASHEYLSNIQYSGSGNAWTVTIADVATGALMMSGTSYHGIHTGALIEAGSEWDDSRVTAQDEARATWWLDTPGGDITRWDGAGNYTAGGPGSGKWNGIAGETPYLSVAGSGSYATC